MAYLRTNEQLDEAWLNAIISLAAVGETQNEKEAFFDADYISEEQWQLCLATRLADGYREYMKPEEENELIDHISELFIYGATS